MILAHKYKTLIETARELLGVDFQLTEQNGQLVLHGLASSAEVKNKLWDIYSQIDPHFISKEIRMEIYVKPEVKACRARLLTDESRLNIHRGPGVASLIIGEIIPNTEVIVLGRTNADWWLIRKQEIEGYCYVRQLEIIED